MSSTESEGTLGFSFARILLDVAEAAIDHGVRTGASLPLRVDDYPAEVREKRGTFVTVRRDETLLGCIGTILPVRPMVADVAKNAHAAVLYDPRCPRLVPEDCRTLRLHISLLGILQPIRFTSEEELIGMIRPGIDGLLLEDRTHRGTFLPSVWESLPDPREFVAHLKLKAGLPIDHWSDTITVQRYTVESIGE